MQHIIEVLEEELKAIDSRRLDVKAAIELLSVEKQHAAAKQPASSDIEKAAPSSGHPAVTRRRKQKHERQHSDGKIGSAPAVPENLDRVYDAIIEIGAAATEQEIRDACGMAEKATKCLQVLIERGKVVQIGKARGTRYAVAGAQVTNSDDTGLDSEDSE